MEKLRRYLELHLTLLGFSKSLDASYRYIRWTHPCHSSDRSRVVLGAPNSGNVTLVIPGSIEWVYCYSKFDIDRVIVDIAYYLEGQANNASDSTKVEKPGIIPNTPGF